jgi:hypothetical protein
MRGGHHAGEAIQLDDDSRICCDHRRVPYDNSLAQAPTTSVAAQASALRTPWGEPDLQGIWTDETDTPLQRPARYANQELFTAIQRAELDDARAAVLGRDARAQRGTEDDVASGYNSAFWSWKRVGPRISLIADPPNGRIPLLTPEAQKIAAAVAAGSMIQRPHRGALNSLRATTPRG